jgi:hypothetical protein
VIVLWPIYFIGCLVTFWVNALHCCEDDDDLTLWTIFGRIILWPLFAVKLLLRVLLAGWKDLLS